jgi:hypothetical protein
VKIWRRRRELLAEVSASRHGPSPCGKDGPAPGDWLKVREGYALGLAQDVVRMSREEGEQHPVAVCR